MGKKIKRILCLSLTFILLIYTSVGCKAEKPESTHISASFTPKLDKDIEAEIYVAGNYRNFEALEAEFDRFSEYYPRVEFRYNYLDSYNATIVPALFSTDAPDIYCMFRWMKNREEYDYLFESAEDLTAPALEIDLDCIRPRLLYTEEDGKVPFVPVFCSTYGMLINEDLFRKHSIGIPENYSDFIKALEAFKAAGYESPVMGYNSADKLFYSLSYPFFCNSVNGDKEAVSELNSLLPEAGERLRPTLELVNDFMKRGFVDLKRCNEFEDSYEAIILRFFEGDVPVMLVDGDTVSGTAKLESMSEAFMEHPFTYSFHPVPVTDKGGLFLNVISEGFAVNKNTADLDITNEFMRFLVTREELNLMAQEKRLVTATTDLSLDGVYASFGDVAEDRVIYAPEVGLLDAPVVQMRAASYLVGNGLMSVDEAIKNFGKLTE